VFTDKVPSMGFMHSCTTSWT